MNVIVDLEHTISNASHRINMKKEGCTKGLFQEEFKNDRPNNNVIIFMKQLIATGSYVIILTSKEEKYRRMVTNWLALHEVEYNQLDMKPNGLDIKPEIFKLHYLDNCELEIDFALDDVGKNCAMFDNKNIPCLRIEQK